MVCLLIGILALPNGIMKGKGGHRPLWEKLGKTGWEEGPLLSAEILSPSLWFYLLGRAKKDQEGLN